MNRIMSSVVVIAFLLSIGWGTALGEAQSFAHTIACKVETSEGSAKGLTDRSVKTYWQSADANSEISVYIPETEVPGYLRIEWFGECDAYILEEHGVGGNILRTRDQLDAYRGIQIIYDLLPDTRTIVLKLSEKNTWIAEIYVYSTGTLPDSVHVWEPPYDEVDMMIVSAHQDDEFIFFGGAIPYAIASGHPTTCLYVTSCGRVRRNEALNGLYAVGMRNYPEFLNFPDQHPKNVRIMAEIWGEESVLEALVHAIRRYRPKVIVTHDRHGEYGHPAHKLTARLMKRAVEDAADPLLFADSAEQYGAYQVQKLYLHLYEEKQIHMDWKRPLDYYGGRTAFEMATVGYAEHVSQHKYYQVEDGGNYDNAAFGLLMTHVGDDVLKDDFFENVIFEAEKPVEPKADDFGSAEELFEENPPNRDASLPRVIAAVGVLGIATGGVAVISNDRQRRRKAKKRRRA